MQKGTRLQTNATSFINQFTQRCTGHDHGHSPIEGGQVVRDTAFYPERFCQRVVQFWKGDDVRTPNRILQTLRKPDLQRKYISYAPAATHATLVCSLPVPRAIPRSFMLSRPPSMILWKTSRTTMKARLNKARNNVFSACIETWDIHRINYWCKSGKKPKHRLVSLKLRKSWNAGYALDMFAPPRKTCEPLPIARTRSYSSNGLQLSNDT